ncbi:dynein axonemal intermediate chain 3 isoform X1 [Chelonia mydas]|uniref:dynein axonemal intermediate chain 3 isoform X1 n=1 Tax=Chelonia mydas TaxID=8469 RepID=UPI0018A23308|nr:dynein axonemal intermediate chain 3 isoform X1 [Chelonia mydas]
MLESPKSSKTSELSPKGSVKKLKIKEQTKAKGSAKGKRKQLGKKDEEVDISMASIGHPEIFPLVFTQKTQEILNCRINEDVTEEKPYKLLKKEDIIQDMKTRAAVSDFHPVKKIVLEYPGEELLVVLDTEFKYGQNFYLVATEEAKKSFLNPPEPVEEEGETKEGTTEEYVYKPPVRKPWVSLGSEKEIEEESVNESLRKIKYMISRVRREFGSKVKFTDRNASSVKDGYIECTSYQDKNFIIKKLEKDVGTQVVPKVREMSTQTKWTYPRNAATQYFPREFSDEEKELCLSSEDLKEFIISVLLRVEIALQQNEIMNAFFDDWKALAEDESAFGGKSDAYLKEYQSFTDLHYLKHRTVSCVCWHPTIYGIIAVSVTERLSYEERIAQSGKLLLRKSPILFWSFSDPIHPQLMLDCPEDIYCFEFCPSDPNIIAGGCMNGQVVLWDISEYEEKLQNAKTGAGGSKNTAVNMPTFIQAQQSGKEPHFVRYCAVSSIEYGHKTVITDIHWLPDYFEVNRMGIAFENRTGVCVQLVTCSPDCSILFWDLRAPKATIQSSFEKVKEEKVIEAPPDVPTTFKHLDLSWRPLIKANLSKSDTSGDYSPTKISLVEEHFHYKMQDKMQYQVKPEIFGDENPYKQLKVPSAKALQILENIPTNFFVGTEDGEVIYSDWKMERESDSGRLISQKPANKYTIHDGIVHTIQRSPFFKDIILSVGGWNFAIWKEGVTSGPILQSCCSSKRYTVGHWSLSRAGVFFIGREDGNIDIWDLLEKTHEPSQTQNISISMITCIKPWIVSSKQHFLAISDNFGTLHILEISWTLSHPSSNERASVLHYFEREVKHLDYFEQRQEFRAKERKELELETQRKKTRVAGGQKSREQMEEQMNINYVDFLDEEKKILTGLGLLKATDRFA